MIPKKFSWEIIGAVIAVDQASKFLAAKSFPHLVIKNSGLPFGIGIPDSPAGGSEFFILAGIPIVLLIFILAANYFFPEERTALSLILGGALSNLSDRVLLGYVRDVISVGISSLNLADLAIFLGIAMLLWNIKLRP